MGALKGRGFRSGLTPPKGLKPRASFGTQADRSRERDQRAPWRAWYKTARWQKFRLKIMRRDVRDISDEPHLMPRHVLFKDDPFRWPVCQKTGVLLTGKHPDPDSPVVDHKEPHRGDPDLFWDERNVEVVSKRYHDSKKQSLEKRGLA